MYVFVDSLIILAQLLLVIAMGVAVWRMIRGPHAQDRVAGLDALYVDALLLLLSVSIRTGSILYIEICLIIALLGFVSSSALAKFLMRGEVIE